MRLVCSIALLLFACSRAVPAPIGRDPAPSAVATCGGERVPTDLRPAAESGAEGVAIAGDGSIGAVVADGQQAEGARGIVVWTSDGRVRERWRIDVDSIAFAGDGRLAFTAREANGILDRRTGCAQRWKVSGGLQRLRGDGRLLVADDEHLRLIDPSSGAIVRETAVDDAVALDVGGDTIAVLDASHLLHLYSRDLSPRSAPPSILASLAEARVVAVSPDGALVAAGEVKSYTVKFPPFTKPGNPFRHRSFVRLVAAASGTEIDRFASAPTAIAFSPDGSALAIAEYGTLSIRTLSTKAMRVLERGLSFAQQLAWSPDGHTLALAEWRGAVRAFDVATGKARELTP
jgi:hypothetical protein